MAQERLQRSRFRQMLTLPGGNDRVASSATLVGQDLSTVDAIIDLTDKPEAPETSSILTPGNGIESITFDNEHLTNSDGSELWQQGNWQNLLFDGVTSGSMAEFKWYLWK